LERNSFGNNTLINEELRIKNEKLMVINVIKVNDKKNSPPVEGCPQDGVVTPQNEK
jgi:hypothetical protein